VEAKMSGNKNLKICLAMALLIPLMSCLAGAKIIYVDDDANGLNDGSSWQNAYKFLQDALFDAYSSPKPVEIRVAQGIYRPDEDTLRPDGTGDRTATFQLINGVTLKGGYAGLGQPDLNVRDVSPYETILSGDLRANDRELSNPWEFPDDPSRTDNCYHVVTGSDTDATAVLDGFIITAGYANGEGYSDDHGVRMYNDVGGPTVDKGTFSENYTAYGAGVCNIGGGTVMTNCKFSRNFASRGGAGMFNSEANPTITNCTFSQNVIFNKGGYVVNGAGMYNEESSPIVTKCFLSKT
jgi:hypothetical protein